MTDQQKGLSRHDGVLIRTRLFLQVPTVGPGLSCLLCSWISTNKNGRRGSILYLHRILSPSVQISLLPNKIQILRTR